MSVTRSVLPIRGIALRLFLTCWLVYGLHFATNMVREIYPALSLGDHLSFDVSEYLGLHPDIFELPGRGAFINNNIGASILGAVPYALARPVIDAVTNRIQRARMASGQPAPDYDTIYPLAKEFYRKAYARGLDVKFGLAAGVIQFFLMAPLSALSVVVVFNILVNLTASELSALFLAILYAFATPVFYRTAQLNQNLLVGHCALFAFALLWESPDNTARPRDWRYLLTGLLAGWAVVLDYSGLVVVVAVSLYALARYLSHPPFGQSRLSLAAYAVGVLLSGAVLMGYQWLAFGNPFLPAQHYMPTTIYSSYGYSGMGWPQPDLLWETAFGTRFGLFTSAPLLLLALYVPGWLNPRIRLLGVRETWFVGLYSLAFFLFASASEYGRLQFGTGVRYIVPVVPFLFLIAAGVLRQMPTRLAIVVGVVATYWSWCLAMYRDVEQGLGIPEAIIHITTGGPRLPWLTTLENLRMAPAWLSAWLVLLASSALLWAIWNCHLSWLRQTLVPAE